MAHLCTSSKKADPDRSQARYPGHDSLQDFLRDLEHLSEPLDLSFDRVLCREGDEPERLFLLKRGEAIFTVHSNGQVIPCFSVRAGSLIGLSAIFARTPCALTATVSPGAEVRQIAAPGFMALVEESPDHYLSILRILAEETLGAHQVLAELLAL